MSSFSLRGFIPEPVFLSFGSVCTAPALGGLRGAVGCLPPFGLSSFMIGLQAIRASLSRNLQNAENGEYSSSY